MNSGLFLLYAGLFIGCSGYSQALDFTAVQARVDFSRTLQEWDGFGFNYVETAHTSDAEATAMDSETAVIAFASNGTKNSDAFVVVHINNKPKKIACSVTTFFSK